MDRRPCVCVGGGGGSCVLRARDVYVCGVVCLGMCVHARAKNLSARLRSSPPPPLLRTDLRHWFPRNIPLNDRIDR